MKILIVDDELGLRHTLTLILGNEGHVMRSAASGVEALDMLAQEDADLVLCDVRMPSMDGLTFLDKYRASQGRARVIMMSAYGDDDDALEAIRRGAYDFLQKPFRADQVLLVVRKAIEREGLRQQVEQLSEEIAALKGAQEIVGHSEALQQAVALARKVAKHRSSVLITGESGTGKELIARLIHRTGSRSGGSWMRTTLTR